LETSFRALHAPLKQFSRFAAFARAGGEGDEASALRFRVMQRGGGWRLPAPATGRRAPPSGHMCWALESPGLLSAPPCTSRQTPGNGSSTAPPCMAGAPRPPPPSRRCEARLSCFGLLFH